MDANVEALDNLNVEPQRNTATTSTRSPTCCSSTSGTCQTFFPRKALNKELRKKNEAVVEAVAFQGVGVFETLKEIAKAGV